MHSIPLQVCAEPYTHSPCCAHFCVPKTVLSKGLNACRYHSSCQIHRYPSQLLCCSPRPCLSAKVDEAQLQAASCTLHTSPSSAQDPVQTPHRMEPGSYLLPSKTALHPNPELLPTNAWHSTSSTALPGHHHSSNWHLIHNQVRSDKWMLRFNSNITITAHFYWALTTNQTLVYENSGCRVRGDKAWRAMNKVQYLHSHCLYTEEKTKTYTTVQRK